ncbi:MAG: 30S ribosomal protein S9 [Candidatus Pacearchaeota archaeon]
MDVKSKVVKSGKRKTSVARAVLVEGAGKVTLNKVDHHNLHEFDKLKIEEPLRIAREVVGNPDYDVNITVRGGGEKSQVEAARLALARALVKHTGSKNLEKAYSEYDRNLLVADTRRKEKYKPGDSKARAKRQSSKR